MGTESDRTDHEATTRTPLRAGRAAKITFTGLMIVATVAFVVLAVLAHREAYFPIDLATTRALQRIDTPLFVGAMIGLSWLGFLPQAAILASAVVVAMFVAGRRREAWAAAFAGASAVVVTTVKSLVHRPRPSKDLVHVLNQLYSPSFPSGHVVLMTAFCGFLVYLLVAGRRRSRLESALVVLLVAVIVLMGPSRMALGHHWLSDVLGAYVLGGMWLALTIHLYRWRMPTRRS